MEGLKVSAIKSNLTKRNWQELKTSYGNTKTTKRGSENWKLKIGKTTPNTSLFLFQ